MEEEEEDDPLDSSSSPVRGPFEIWTSLASFIALNQSALYIFWLFWGLLHSCNLIHLTQHKDRSMAW